MAASDLSYRFLCVSSERLCLSGIVTNNPWKYGLSPRDQLRHTVPVSPVPSTNNHHQHKHVAAEGEVCGAGDVARPWGRGCRPVGAEWRSGRGRAAERSTRPSPPAQACLRSTEMESCLDGAAATPAGQKALVDPPDSAHERSRGRLQAAILGVSEGTQRVTVEISEICSPIRGVCGYSGTLPVVTSPAVIRACLRLCSGRRRGPGVAVGGLPGVVSAGLCVSVPNDLL